MAQCLICGKDTDIPDYSTDDIDVEVICSLMCLDIWELLENATLVV